MKTDEAIRFLRTGDWTDMVKLDAALGAAMAALREKQEPV